MLKKLIILVLLLPVVPVAVYLTRAAWAHPGPAAEAGAQVPEAVIDPVSLVTRAPRSVTLGSRVDVCLTTGVVVKRLTVQAVSCGKDQCRAIVRLPGGKVRSILSRYDFDRPPTVMAPGASC